MTIESSWTCTAIQRSVTVSSNTACVRAYIRTLSSTLSRTFSDRPRERTCIVIHVICIAVVVSSVWTGETNVLQSREIHRRGGLCRSFFQNLVDLFGSSVLYSLGIYRVKPAWISLIFFELWFLIWNHLVRGCMCVRLFDQSSLAHLQMYSNFFFDFLCSEWLALGWYFCSLRIFCFYIRNTLDFPLLLRFDSLLQKSLCLLGLSGRESLTDSRHVIFFTFRYILWLNCYYTQYEIFPKYNCCDMDSIWKHSP